MTTVANLVANLTANTTGLTSGLKSAERDVQSFSGNTSKAFGKLGKAAVAGAAVAAAAVVAGAAKSVAAFADFERGMNEVFTLLPGITGDAMSEMEGQVKDLSKEFGVLPDEVVPALYQAISAGVPSDNVFDFMETATKASIAGVTELETAVDGISSVINAFGAETIDATEASDLMFTAVRLGKTTFDELSRSLFQVNPVAAGLGIEFGDITAALAAMTAQGTPTSVATTQLRQALVELGKEGTDAFDTFKTATGQTFPDFIAGGGNVEGAFDAMKTHADDMGVGVGDLFGSVEAGMGVISLTSESGAVAFGDAMDEMQTAAGSTDTAFDTMNQGLSRSWDRIKATFGVALIDIGEKLSPFVTQFADWFEDTLPSAIDTFMGVLDSTISVVSNFVAGMGAIKDFIDGLPSSVTTVVTVLGGLTIALAAVYANPIVVGLTLVAGLIVTIGSDAKASEERLAGLVDNLREMGTISIDNLSDAVGSDLIAAMRDAGVTVGQMRNAIIGTDEDMIRFKKTLLEAARSSDVLDGAYGHIDSTLRGLRGEWQDAVVELDRMTNEENLTTAAVIDLTTELDNQERRMNDLDTSNVVDGVDDIGDALGDSADDFGQWEDEMITAAEVAEHSVDRITDAFDGAPDKIKTSVDEMIANIHEQRTMATEFGTAMETLMNAGLDEVVKVLLEAGPAAVDQAQELAGNMEKAYELELTLGGTTADAIKEIASARNLVAVAQQAHDLARAAENAFDPILQATVQISVVGDTSGNLFPGADKTPKVSVTSQMVTPKSTISGGVQMAAGGIVTSPTIATIGEAGEPEAVVPLSRAAEFGFGGEGPVNNFYIERVESDDLPGDISEGLTLASVASQVDMFGDF